MVDGGREGESGRFGLFAKAGASGQVLLIDLVRPSCHGEKISYCDGHHNFRNVTLFAFGIGKDVIFGIYFTIWNYMS